MINFALVCVLSACVHEYGHAIPAKLLGWKLHGWVLRWYGVGYAVEPNGKGIRVVALGGLLATLNLCLAGFFLSSIDILAINIPLLLVNSVPIPRKSDGWIIWKGRFQ